MSTSSGREAPDGGEADPAPRSARAAPNDVTAEPLPQQEGSTHEFPPFPPRAWPEQRVQSPDLGSQPPVAGDASRPGFGPPVSGQPVSPGDRPAVPPAWTRAAAAAQPTEADIAEALTDRATGLLAGGSLNGALPDPDAMRAYAAMFPDAPERLLRIVESQTVDASARADRLVKAEIASAKQARQAATVIVAVCVVCAIVLLFRDRLTAAAILLILPIITMIRSSLDERHPDE